MKDFEPLPGSKGDKPGGDGQDMYVIGPDGKRSFRFWVLSSREFDDLKVSHPQCGFNKVARAIMCHISRREDDEDGCYAGLRDMARYCGSHIDWVKHELKKLVALGIVLRTKRPGATSILRLADKMKWLEMNPPHSGRRPPTQPPEESRETADRQIRNALWTRIWNLPGGRSAPRKPFERMMDKDLALFEQVVTEMENRVKRGLPENRKTYGADALDEVKNFTGLFVDTFGRWVKANGRSTTGQ